MNNHYIPQLLLKQFAVRDKVNVYNLATSQFSTQKIRKVFSEENLFDEELEQLFAKKLEGPFGDLLNHKLLKEDTIRLERRENLLIRKFFMVNDLRSPYMNGTWEEMVAKTKSEEQPSVQLLRFLKRHHPDWEEIAGVLEMSEEEYIRNLRKAMEIDSLEHLSNSDQRLDVSEKLRLFACMSIVAMIGFWDSSDSGQEFIFPKLQGISEMDQAGIAYKGLVLKNLQNKKEIQKMRPEVQMQLDMLFYGSSMFSENYAVYPISPARMLVKISPYFKVFFPIWQVNKFEKRALLSEEQFRINLYSKLRMKLFEPCESIKNKAYIYRVKKLTKEEVCMLNALMLNVEPDQFVFHDFNRIRDSFWYYDHVSKFVPKKRYDFSNLE